MKIPAVTSLLALNDVQIAQASEGHSSNVVSMPIHLLYGSLSKVTTSVMVGSANKKIGQSIEVVVDYGSSGFWVFGPNATINYGSQYLGFQGACNTTPQFYYHTDDFKVSNFSGTYSYGGNSKILDADKAVNDTLYFPSSLPGPSIPNIKVALVSSGTVRQYVADGDPCPGLSYDYGIMGLASTVGVDSGPNIKSELLSQGRISSSIVSMYFDSPPANSPPTYNYTGTVLFGSLPPSSSYTGSPVSVPIVTPAGEGEYYISLPTIAHGNTSIAFDYPDTTCLVDSGSLALSLPYSSDNTEFFQATGFSNYDYDVAYPSACEDIPRDLTLDFTFKNATTSTTVKLPYRYLARGSSGPGGVTPEGMCIMSISLGSECTFGAPWFLGSSVGVDDDEKVVWIAQAKL
ncbi:103b91a9-d8c4-44de-ad4a-48a355db1a4e [Sclerotinia trifoliorum]|uniref:103b91a9-d8c4-44de-ad4a-48a355db1a4e n=1 Tax=Sclerotinia trifoliorum TaxID=28548 RepID=A0A8H2W1A4_9HELO|nr:103b91a9-d8c4-44de-ad4a-48a355db1a4e [Sclerotinia trifoliorum]